MATIAHSYNTVDLDAALRGLATQARTRYAGQAARIDRGLVIALNGGVTLLADDAATVQSSSDPEVQYRVNGHCDCRDAEHAPEGRCKHRWATCLVRKARTQRAAAQRAHTYYATYYAPDDSCTQGTAQHVAGRGWLFVADDGGDLFYASQDALVLGGRCDIADAKRAEEDAAGGLATLVGGDGTRV